MQRHLFLSALTLFSSLLVLPQAQAKRIPRPVIERIQPTSGTVGTKVDIVGRFINGDIFFGPAKATVISRTPNRVTVTVPPGASTGSILLQTPWGGKFAGPYFRVTATTTPPTFTRFFPKEGSAGMEVTLYGTRFSPRLSDNSVQLGGRPVVIRSATPTELKVIVPAGAMTGAFTINVRGAGSVTGTLPFTVATAVAVTKVEPLMGPVRSKVTVYGTGFSPKPSHNRVYFGTRKGRVLSVTPTALLVEVPRRAVTSKILVDVRRVGRATSTDTFIIQEAPRVVAVSPRSMVPGAEVKIRGTGFGSDVRAVTVWIGDRPATVRRVLPNEIVVVVPTGAANNTLKVRVHRLQTSLKSGVDLRAKVAIRSFSPRSGGPGTVVILKGVGFSRTLGQIQVSIGGRSAKMVAATPKQIRFRVPRGAVSGPIRVAVTHGGVAISTSPFVVTTPPIISRFEPAFGAVGSTVTIMGQGFGTNPRALRVDLGGVVMRLQSVSDTRIVAVVPKRAKTARISINARLVGGSVSRTEFSVVAKRRVFSVTPANAAVGTEVAIHGEGFPRGKRIMVQFGGPTRPVVARRIGPAELRAIVPSGAVSDVVKVYLPNERVMVSPAPLTITKPAGMTVAGTMQISSVTALCVAPGCKATLRGNGFSPTARWNRVSFGGQTVQVISATSTTLTVKLPNKPGTHAFQVTVRRGSTAKSQPFSVARLGR